MEYIMVYTTKSEFVDVDTGEILPYTHKEQLKQTNYLIINIKKTYNYDKKNGKCLIRRTNECRHTGQRTFDF
jgi:hypothetical protein